MTDIMTASVPSHWTIERLGQLFRERKQKVSDKEFQPLSVTKNGVVPQLETAAKTDDGDNRRGVLAGDFVINSRSDRKGSSGLSALNGSVSLINIVLEPLRIHPRFAHHLLRSRAFQEEFYRWGHGIVADLWTTRYFDMKNIRVGVPDKKTQVEIVDFLDRETARIDQLIEHKQLFLNLAHERWESTLDTVICGRDQLDTPFRVDHDFIQTLPDKWSLSPLMYLTDVRRPIMYGIVLPGPNVENGVMIVKGGDVKPHRLNPESLCRTTVEIERSYARSRLKRGDLVIAIRGGIGEIEVVPQTIEGANLTQDAARIAPRNGILNIWLRYAIQAPSVFAPLASKATGAAVRGINIFDLKRLRVPTPPPEAQEKIADILAKKELQINSLRTKIQRHSEIIRELRASLITAAATGQLDISKWRIRGTRERTLDAIEAEITV